MIWSVTEIGLCMFEHHDCEETEQDEEECQHSAARAGKDDGGATK